MIYVRAYATCLGDERTHVVGLGHSHHRSPSVRVHRETRPAPLLFAELDARVGCFISAGACGAGIGAGDEGEEKGKGEEEVHQATHCELSKALWTSEYIVLQELKNGIEKEGGGE